MEPGEAARADSRSLGHGAPGPIVVSRLQLLLQHSRTRVSVSQKNRPERVGIVWDDAQILNDDRYLAAVRSAAVFLHDAKRDAIRHPGQAHGST